MAVEYFKRSGRSFSPKASIRKGGQIGLNNGAIVRYKIQDKDTFLLGYDREAKKIHLKQVSKDEEGAKKISITAGNGSISAKSFLDYFEITYENAKSYEATQENNEIVFKLENIENNTNV